MGCVPVRIVFDNATGIGKRIQDELQEHEAFTRFRLHYGFEATFTNPYAGQEKGSVENAVGTFRRNRLVPLLRVHGNLETFNRNVMLPLSDAYRVDDEHYLKGRMVRELFEEDRKCMRPLPAADFRVCRVDVCTAHDGLVKLDGKFEYHLDPVVNGKVLVEKTMYTVAFHRMDGKLLEKCDRLYDSQEVYYNLPAILNGLVRKTKAWRNSIVREQMEDGSLKDLIDGLADENEKFRLFTACTTTGLFTDKAIQPWFGFPQHIWVVGHQCLPTPVNLFLTWKTHLRLYLNKSVGSHSFF